jgi:hypothetical protein
MRVWAGVVVVALAAAAVASAAAKPLGPTLRFRLPLAR